MKETVIFSIILNTVISSSQYALLGGELDWHYLFSSSMDQCNLLHVRQNCPYSFFLCVSACIWKYTCLMENNSPLRLSQRKLRQYSCTYGYSHDLKFSFGKNLDIRKVIPMLHEKHCMISMYLSCLRMEVTAFWSSTCKILHPVHGIIDQCYLPMMRILPFKIRFRFFSSGCMSLSLWVQSHDLVCLLLLFKICGFYVPYCYVFILPIIWGRQKCSQLSLNAFLESCFFFKWTYQHASKLLYFSNTLI